MKNHEIWGKVNQKSSRGPSGGALAPPGVPKGSQRGFWERKVVSVEPPPRPIHTLFAIFRRVGPSCKNQTKKTDMRSNRYLRRFSHFGKETAGSLDPPWTLRGLIFGVFFDVKTVCCFYWFLEACWTDFGTMFHSKISLKTSLQRKRRIFENECFV